MYVYTPWLFWQGIINMEITISTVESIHNHRTIPGVDVEVEDDFEYL